MSNGKNVHEQIWQNPETIPELEKHCSSGHDHILLNGV